ncbi:MAG: response regulator, partial [Patescibacteria group bacterium]|nr:response regulator [Patescibacteria group bacterium]
FDVALIDIGLPQIDGFELARRIRSRPAFNGTLLAALTGYGQPEDRRRALEAGFDVHLVKPLDFPQFFALLSERFGVHSRSGSAIHSLAE